MGTLVRLKTGELAEVRPWGVSDGWNLFVTTEDGLHMIVAQPECRRVLDA